MKTKKGERKIEKIILEELIGNRKVIRFYEMNLIIMPILNKLNELIDKLNNITDRG